MVLRDRSGNTSDDEMFHVELLRAAREAGRPLTEAEAGLLTTHYRLLRHWSRRMNLTGLKDRESILRRHFLEPIVAATLLGDEGTLLDLGSGNGFLAVPLNILHPGLQMILVEASERKSMFLWELVREIGLKAARVETRRVCRRADLSDILPVRWLTFRGIKASGLLRGPGPDLLQEGGRLLAFVSRGDAREMHDLAPDLRWVEDRPLPDSPGDVVAVFR